jgi:glycerol-3-phosphate acyltransferase PlsY
MSTVLLVGLAVGSAYLLGAVPFGYLIGRARGVDVRTVGSRNIGATNVFRTVGKGPGILTFVCDMLKGFVAICGLPLLTRSLGLESGAQSLPIACGCAAIAGHNWPVYLRFRGGKGVATTAGVLLGVGWGAMLIGLGVWLVTFVLSRYVSLASVAAAVAVPVAAWRLYAERGPLVPWTLTALGALVVWRHKGNIGRLLRGTENRFSFGRRRAGTSAEAEPRIARIDADREDDPTS